MSWDFMLACEQAFCGDLAVGRKKEGELATTSLEFDHLQNPCGSPSTELSDLRQSARSKNERECKQTRAKGNDVITNIISANQHFESILFDADIQIPETKLQHNKPVCNLVSINVFMWDSSRKCADWEDNWQRCFWPGCQRNSHMPTWKNPGDT